MVGGGALEACSRMRGLVATRCNGVATVEYRCNALRLCGLCIATDNYIRRTLLGAHASVPGGVFVFAADVSRSLPRCFDYWWSLRVVQRSRASLK